MVVGAGPAILAWAIAGRDGVFPCEKEYPVPLQRAHPGTAVKPAEDLLRHDSGVAAGYAADDEATVFEDAISPFGHLVFSTVRKSV